MQYWQSYQKSRCTSLHILFASCAIATFAGCVTHIAPPEAYNPPPEEKFSSFNRFELLPLRQVAETKMSESALNKIQQNIDMRLRSQIDDWNGKASEAPVRTLIIQPEIADGKFVSGGKRFWFGSLAGSSAVILHATFTEKETKKVIAEADFFARANAYGGAWTFGATDNVMLIRIANSFAAYVVRNYQHAMGGPVMPTGEEVPAAKLSGPN